MLTPAQRAFRTALQDGDFAPAYYLFGEDEYLKEEAMRRLIERAVDPATRDFNLEVRRGGELDAETLGSLLGTPPMMAERRVIVIREAAALKKEPRTVLERYLEHPAPDVVVTLIGGTAIGKVEERVAERTLAVEFTALSPDQLPKWIVQRVESDFGGTITADAAALLASAVGSDLAQLSAELDKLASYANGAPIDEPAVSAVVGVRRGETLADLLDRVAARDAAGALALLPHVLEQPKAAAVPIVMALTTQTLALAWARAMLDAGSPPRRLEGEFFGFLSEARSSPTGRPWKEAIQSWLRSVGRWDAASLDAALRALLAADIALKESRISSDEQLLASLILSLCSGAVQRAA